MILTPGEMQFFAFIAKILVDIAFFCHLALRESFFDKQDAAVYVIYKSVD
jgi:hypothetical protein